MLQHGASAAAALQLNVTTMSYNCRKITADHHTTCYDKELPFQSASILLSNPVVISNTLNSKP
jgi:hypothetical protein